MGNTNKKEEKKFTYEDNNIKIEKTYSKKTTIFGETESYDKKITVKNPNVNYLDAKAMYPRIAEGGEY